LTTSSFSNLPKINQIVFALGLLGILIGSIGIETTTNEVWILFFDNLHWTSSTIAAAILSYLGMKQNSLDTMNKSAVSFFIGFSGYAIGQIIWDIQIFFCYSVFPSPSDFFYLLLGVGISFAIFYEIDSQNKKFNKTAYWLDLLALGVATLTLVLISYLPRQGGLDVLSMAVLVAYPVTLIIPILMLSLLVLVIQLKLDTKLLLFLITLSITAYSWMDWNSMALDGKTINGSWHNVLFSISILLSGLVVSKWRLAYCENLQYERYSEAFLMFLPIITVIFSSIAIVIVASNPFIKPIIADLVYIGAAIVTILAIIRQSRLLHERDQLIELQRKAIRSTNLIQTIVQNVPVRILWKDKDLKYLGLNNLCAKDAGFEKPSDVIGKSDFEMGWKDQAELYRADDFAVMKSGIPIIGYEEMQTTPDGNQIWLRTSKIPLIDELSGEMIGIFGVYDDITEQKTIIEELKKQKEEFETIFRNSKDGIAILDLESNFLDFNDAYIELAGFSRNELLTKSCIGLTLPAQKERSKIAIEDTIKNGYVQNFEKSCIVKDDKIVTINMSLSLMPDKKRILVSAKDVTHLKLLEEQSKLASMGEMIGNISHQWRQPLSVISTGVTGMKLKKEFDMLTDEMFNETCDTINRNAQYLSKTIDDFKNFIKGDSTPVEFNLKDNLDSFIKLMHSTIKKYNIKTILNLKEDTTIKGYPNELIQCFINIFNNSKDALVENMPEDDRYVFIEEKTTKDKIIITIKDNAGGIPQNVLLRIFEPYFTTKHKSQGTGLGLHMTYKLIVEGMDGSIEASNVHYEYEGKKYTGAEFTIAIPLFTS
jgi:PAS domain S-box-containing protein